MSELWDKLERTVDDSTRIHTLATLATRYTRINPDSAVLLAESAINAAQEGQFINLEAKAYTSLGEAYDVSGKIELSLENFEKGLQLFEQQKDEEGIGRVYNSRGLAYFYSGNSAAALDDFLVAKTYVETTGEPAKMAKNYHNLGLTYSRLNESYDALRYYLLARNLKDSLVNVGDPEINAQEQLSTYINLGALYISLNQLDKARESLQTALGIATDEQIVRRMGILYNLGAVEEQDSNYVEAEQFYQQSLELAITSNMIPRQPYIYDALGNIARKQKSTEQAATYYKQALLIMENINIPDVKASTLIDQGNLFLDQGQLTQAIENAEAGKKIAEEYSIQQQQIDAYDLLARAAELMGNTPDAAKYLRQYTDLKAKVDGESKRQELIGLQAIMDVELSSARYEKELRDQELAISQRWVNRLVYALIAIAILAIALAVSRRKVVKTSQELALSNMNLADKNIELATSSQKLGIANNKLQQFAFATGHDLKESLRNITSFTQLASIEMAEDLPTAQTHLKEAAAGGKRMRKMLDDLLHYSNVGGDETVRAAVPLKDAVSSVKQQLKEDILAAQGDVHLMTPATLKANRNEVEQLLFNLIHNALRYRNPEIPARIQIKLEERPKGVVFQVKDNGTGVPEAEQKAIFKAFHRLHNRMQSGSGLGLAICQRVVQSYDGEIWHETAPEGGSVFCFTLPNAEPKGQF